MKISILGTGCPKCERLFENAAQAAAELGIDHQIEKITDIRDIAAHGVMLTPALALDGEVVLVGKTPDVGELKELLTRAGGGKAG